MIASLGLVIVLQTPTPASPKVAAFESRYAQLNDALKKASYADFKSWLATNATSDFSLRLSNGNLASATETLANIKREFLIIRTVKAATFRLRNFSAHSDHVSCSVKSHLEFVSKDGSRYVQDSVAVDTWHPAGNSWKLYSMVTTKEKLSLNGKVTRTFGINSGEVFP